MGACVLGTQEAALAANDVTLFAGGQSGFANYGFLGATIALPGSSIGKGFALRDDVFAGSYSYVNASGLVNAHFAGDELDAVYQFSSGGFWSDFGLGARYADSDFSRYGQTNRRRGEQMEPVASIDGGDVSGPWRTDWNAFYGTRLDDYAARLSLTHTLNSQWRVGVEAYSEGDPTYNLRQFGPYIAWHFSDRSELQFSAGPTWESGQGSRAYVRASLYSTL